MKEETERIGLKMENHLTRAMWQDGVQRIFKSNWLNPADSVMGPKVDKN